MQLENVGLGCYILCCYGLSLLNGCMNVRIGEAVHALVT